MFDKKILIFGGTGPLGNALTDYYIDNNEIIVYSRDECKQWEMKIRYHNNPKLSFHIGDIRDSHRVHDIIEKTRPNIIIIASAIKHIDICELSTHECIQTNLNGVKNILDCIDNNKRIFKEFLETVCFVSTDKACSPVNIYGMSKAMSEVLMIEKAYYLKDFKFVCVRYGNVLNSRGSIIPFLHKLGQDNTVENFSLTHPDMTRFIMTLEQSVNLINHAINNCESGDIVVPKLEAMKIVDLLDIFSEIYNKPYVLTKLRPGEKLAEALINETQSMRMIIDTDGYHIIKPNYSGIITNELPTEYNSNMGIINKDELRDYLANLKLI